MMSSCHAAPDAPNRDATIDDVLATLDTIERQLHEALMLAQASCRVFHETLSTAVMLRSQVERRRDGCSRPSMLTDDGVSRSRCTKQLSPREREVLDLIADGRSNRQIAEALFLSPRTVERHIANIYLKIDVHTKAEATAWACYQRLTATPSGAQELAPCRLPSPVGR
jgi:DNA-binding NarL/FixJ family response regulator